MSGETLEHDVAATLDEYARACEDGDILPTNAPFILRGAATLLRRAAPAPSSAAAPEETGDEPTNYAVAESLDNLAIYMQKDGYTPGQVRDMQIAAKRLRARSPEREPGAPDRQTLLRWAEWMRKNPWRGMMARVRYDQSYWNPADFLEAVAAEMGSDFEAVRARASHGGGAAE